MSKPSILLIPGSFGLPEFYDPIVDAVAAQGYLIRALHPPSVGTKAGHGNDQLTEPPSMYDDAALIAGEAEKLAGEGKDVILVAHSYGGTPTTESTKGLGKEERQKQGKKGGIVNIAYMTALVPAVGVSAAGVLADVPKEQQLDLKIDVRSIYLILLRGSPLTARQGKGWMYHDPISRSAEICFSDISQERGEAWMRKFPKHSAVSFTNELTHAGYEDIPVSYLLCEEDLCIPLKTSRRASIW